MISVGLAQARPNNWRASFWGGVRSPIKAIGSHIKGTSVLKAYVHMKESTALCAPHHCCTLWYYTENLVRLHNNYYTIYNENYFSE